MKIVFGVIGSDIHSIGNKILQYALRKEGMEGVNLGVQVSQEEFIEAARETAADAIFVESLYGHAKNDCEGFRDKCIESGLKNILLYIEGNLTTDYSEKWPEIERQFKEMGFDRVYPSGISPRRAINDLRTDLEMRGKRI